MIDYLSSNKLFNIVCKKTKGSLKAPCLCMGIIALFLFVFVSFSPTLVLNSYAEKSDLCLVEENIQESNLFCAPIKSFSSESPEFVLIGNNSMIASTPPNTFSSQVLGALVTGYESEDVEKVITEYIVEEGDTLWSLAEKFDISMDTIFGANDLNKNSVVKPGQKLVILPVSGMVHHVKSGDTISSIAQTYKGKTDDIIAFNDLANENAVYVGDIIVVPNGTMPSVTIQKQQAPSSVPLASSYFICPHSACRITQWLHWYNAIDFGGKCGDPIRAVAAGTVLKVQMTSSTSRWAFGGAGSNLTILHPNGVVTMYGHLSASLVSPGEVVSQGQIVALMGGKPGTPGAGMSTGCHVHFGVTGAKNPFNR
ncbi:MAG: M23 family metallopeptidase [Candidatus Pacebacteria bacterium]|nr:M23 family metallopeptidase [Candidatus Paceibacterota bacterium]